MRDEHATDCPSAEIWRLRAQVKAWEEYWADLREDFIGLYRDAENPLHEWEWLDEHRPSPTVMALREVLGEALEKSSESVSEGEPKQ